LKLFFLFWAILILQRLAELVVAKQNEKWMKKHGGVEFGQKHYRIMVILHTLFFLVYFGEVYYLKKELSPIWPLLISFFILTQAGRIWALTSLGRYWNTKIIVLPDADVVIKGPYKYLRHPNYVIVTLEFIMIPLLFQAYLTCLIFSFLNIWILSVRIPEEEKALSKLTTYSQALGQARRFFPKL
jgi:methyltransferase